MKVGKLFFMPTGEQPPRIYPVTGNSSFIYVSAGVRGLQLKVAPEALIGYVHATVADISREA